MNTAPLLEVQDLHVRFQSGGSLVDAVRGVSFDLGREKLAIVGESGSGKTTVLRCLAGQYNHWHGRLAINGEKLGRKLDKARCRKVQMVFQDPYGSLHSRHTVETALAEPLRIHGIGNISQRIDSILTKVGLPTSFRYRYPHQLSGGQRQRVAIARALILEPRILLLDEPTSALDVSVQAEILNLLADLRQKEGLTYLLVTHDLGVVAHLCDRVAVMQQGRIVDLLDCSSIVGAVPEHPYTRMLVEASRHYSREMVDAAQAA
ncbi:MAG: peptide ABC transporter ATP-binding protein [Candidatus Dactylopiibacterium carminicum]|uniref:Glutathione import ATP-binding protein GsiA n=1 Tax=Candidatus Dactylopiibacterium carminicum TaxID=857335 RepID=A0A272EW39_9RHOO|nr:ABC transporter ATP-binding protein [Candidatus Dactylopiibacterium carminicum]KAF7599629.1 ABC transporter ATP-binding protein [Candidatus Dactylopiibacterium carminicum]PAS94323.1 MAG: peptide ABC transporter ATP-binding protein [Candidatus Dactylopiibacterium carminicum]PAS98517.1 MAG: peptide ABC transporter ATP-binding protein [Candidatus Dactylopiibacterium carminicum]PAS99631.1 MAG: peptide ABC transporter ATP-binding protein [Candidatus Dactylopiibacterium carminicum]